MTGIQQHLDQVREMGLNVNQASKEALIESKKYVNSNLYKHCVKPNYPRGGTYSNGTLRDSIDNDMRVEFNKGMASIKVGFDFKISGLESVFLMYGTARQDKKDVVPELYDDIYNDAYEIRYIQHKVLDKYVFGGGR